MHSLLFYNTFYISLLSKELDKAVPVGLECTKNISNTADLTKSETYAILYIRSVHRSRKTK